VGAGTGTLAAAAGKAGAAVTAVDPDPAMVHLALRAAPDAEVGQAGLPDLPFADGVFDAVVSNFVVNHVPDPRASLRELARVAAPGARVVVTIWPSGRNEQSRLWADVIAESGAVPVPGTVLPEHLDFPRTSDGLAGLLDGAGLRDVRAGALRWEHRAHPQSLWQGAAAGVGGIGTTVVSQSPEVRARMAAAYERLVGRLVQDGELRFTTEAIVAVGTRR
jgi:SAM-dependent methyltransferase